MFVMYCIYGESGLSLLIESTDSLTSFWFKSGLYYNLNITIFLLLCNNVSCSHKCLFIVLLFFCVIFLSCYCYVSHIP